MQSLSQQFLTFFHVYPFLKGYNWVYSLYAGFPKNLVTRNLKVSKSPGIFNNLTCLAVKLGFEIKIYHIDKNFLSPSKNFLLNNMFKLVLQYFSSFYIICPYFMSVIDYKIQNCTKIILKYKFCTSYWKIINL